MRLAHCDNDAKRFAPTRPSINIVLLCSLACWASCAFFYSSLGTAEPDLCFRSFTGALVVLIVCLASCLSARARFAALSIAAAAAGACLASSAAYNLHYHADNINYDEPFDAYVTLLEDAKAGSYSQRALARQSLGGGSSRAFEASIRFERPLLNGEVLHGKASATPVNFEDDSYCWSEGACARIVLDQAEVVPQEGLLAQLFKLRQKSIESLSGDDDAHGLLQALVCGYRRTLSDSALYKDFQTCGLAHLVAVSGTHLVIVTGVLSMILKALRLRRGISISMLIALMACYYVIAGMPVSALRALAMSALSLMAYFGRRRPAALNALGVGILAILCFDPPACVSASFSLSALSTLGIVMFSPLLSFGARLALPNWLAKAGEGITLTLASMVTAQLYAASLFNQLPLISPIANAVCAPLLPVVCILGLSSAFATLFGVDPFGALACAASLSAHVLNALVELLAALPYASVPFYIEPGCALALTFVVVALLWILWPSSGKKFVSVGVTSLLLALIAVFPSTIQIDAVTMLDVGQGDSFLVQSKGANLLIDTGNQDRKLLKELARNRISHIDSVLITHADDDHCGSLDLLERSVDIDRVIVLSDMLDSTDKRVSGLVSQSEKTAREVIGVRAGDAFALGAFTVRIIWPHIMKDEGGNADSLCLVLEYDADRDGSADFKALMTGDAEKEELEAMLENGSVGEIDLLKVGHHGSRNAMTPDELAILNPKVSFISCGKGNRYGHPAQETLDMLSQEGVAVFRSDRDGEVRCKLDNDEYVIECLQ